MFFVSCEAQDYYQLSRFGRTASAILGVKRIIFFYLFSIFESGSKAKHLMSGTLGNKHLGSRRTKLTASIGANRQRAY